MAGQTPCSTLEITTSVVAEWRDNREIIQDIVCFGLYSIMKTLGTTIMFTYAVLVAAEDFEKF